jgi:DNA-binding MarR family transcriptional regulator
VRNRHDHVDHVLEQWRKEAPQINRASFGVVGRIARLAQLLDAELEPVFARHGLNGGEFDVLAALRRAGRPYRLTPTALSDALLVTSGGMSKRLSALARRGLVGRAPDPSDGRSTVVFLTPEGKRLVERILPEHVANEDRLLAGIARKDRGELSDRLERLAVALGDEADARVRHRRPRQGPSR